mgnify:CR=1 FL=1
MNRSGRPKNSKNKLPNNELVCELINTIITDLTDNYSKLTTNQKIKILNVVKHKLILEQDYQNTNEVIKIIITTDERSN